MSQSLKSVHWRFLREDRHIEQRNIVVNIGQQQSQQLPFTGVSSFSSAVSTGPSQHAQALPPAEGSLATGSSILSNAQPSRLAAPGALKNLEEELASTDFPSQVFKYLSLGEDSISGGKFPNTELPSQSTLQPRDSADRNDYNTGELLDQLPADFDATDVEREMARFDRAAGISGVAEEGDRVTDSAEATGEAVSDDDDDDDEIMGTQHELDRPESPIIIWRPSARVRVADDLPDHLVAELLGEPVKPAKPAPTFSSAAPKPRRKLRKASGKVSGAANAGVPKSERARPPACGAKTYGAWYMKPGNWNGMHKGTLAQEYRESKQKQSTGADVEVERALNAKAQEFKSILPKLFISSAYREWLEKQNKGDPDTALSLPHYLQPGEASH